MYEDNLLFKIAWYYYFDNMTQQQISTGSASRA